MDADPESTQAGRLTALADAGWPALETIAVGGWSARFSAGVTKRANSVVPRGDVMDVVAAIESVESLYRARVIRPTFQLTEDDRALEGVLRDRGYGAVDETLIMVAPVAEVARSGAVRPRSGDGDHVGAVSIGDEPDAAWLDVWWGVDGRGGDVERDVARRIMTGGPALYATVCDEDGPACVGRLALVGEWGGLYAIATRSDARRRGHARSVIAGLGAAAAERGVTELWLQVLADNAVAVGLYRSLGFVPAGGYRYLVAPAEYASASRPSR